MENKIITAIFTIMAMLSLCILLSNKGQTKPVAESSPSTVDDNYGHLISQVGHGDYVENGHVIIYK